MPPPLDLSKATKLKDVEFWLAGPYIRWIVMTLEPPKLQERKTLSRSPSARLPTFHDLIEETVHQEWQDLDHLLVELWTSHSIFPKVTPVIYTGVERGNRLSELVESLLPELASRGAVNAVEGS